MKRWIHASSEVEASSISKKKVVKASTRGRIGMLEERIADLENYIEDAKAAGTDIEDLVDEYQELEELKEQLNFAWQDDEAEYNYALQQQEFNPDGSLKGYDDLYASTTIEASDIAPIMKDLDWVEGLNQNIDGHSFTVTGVNGWNWSCQITEEWISEDTWEDRSNTEWYNIKPTESSEDLYFVNRKYPDFRFCASAAFNYDSKCPKEFNVYEKYSLEDETNDNAEYDYDDYTPSATRGDYSPSNPWDAPGMSIHDFI